VVRALRADSSLTGGLHVNPFLTIGGRVRRARTRPVRSIWQCVECGGERGATAVPRFGLCTACALRRESGRSESGPGFFVWDEEPRRAEDWAAELRGGTGRPR
jgi:hypothetical protein